MSDDQHARTPENDLPDPEASAPDAVPAEAPEVSAPLPEGSAEPVFEVVEAAPIAEPAAEAAAAEPPLYGVGPVTVRELVLGAVWLVAFFFSFFSITPGPFASVWTSGLLWILTIGVPTVALFLILLRRFSPEGIRRVGSLGVDQFASVAFSVSAVVWLQMLWDTIAFASSTGIWARSWVIWVELVLMLAGVVLTVFAPFIPVLRDDFRGRPEQPAHANARQVRPVVPRPAPAPRPYAEHARPAAEPQPAHQTGPVYETGPVYDSGPVQETGVTEAIPDQPVRYEAFWALAPVERDVVDEYGTPLFRIGPTAWALVVEDRGTVFVVRHEDGRVGYLHDVSDVVRG